MKLLPHWVQRAVPPSDQNESTINDDSMKTLNIIPWS